jgi:hypothetical protein
MAWNFLPCHLKFATWKTNIPKILHDMAWNILPHHLKFATWKMDIPRIFHDMAWNIFKDSFLLK